MNDYKKQADDFLKKANATIEIKKAERQQDPLWHKDGEDYGYMYNITIKREGKRDWKFNFWGSVADKKAGEFSPSSYDILACITKYNPGTFSVFCSCYGYDEDSKTAEKTFIAVVNEWNECERMFSDLMDELQEIN